MYARAMSIRAGVLASFRLFHEAVAEEDAVVTKQATLVHQASVHRMSMRAMDASGTKQSTLDSTTRLELDAIGEHAVVEGDSDDDTPKTGAATLGTRTVAHADLSVNTAAPSEEQRRVFSAYPSDADSGDEAEVLATGTSRSGGRTGKVRG